MGRKTHGPLLVEAIESNNLRLTSNILSKHFNDKSKLQQFLWTPVPRPLFECLTEVPMLLAASLAEPAILNFLVTSCGADVNRLYTSGHPKRQKQTTCMIAAVRKSAYAVVSYLLNIGCDPNRPDQKNRTPLHHAVRRADFAMAKLLLSKGASHDRVDSAGNTPLHVATLYGHTQLVSLLAKSGADLYKQGHFGALPLHMAAKEGHAHLVSLFCITFEVNPSLKIPCYDGLEKSPLHLAAMRGHVETVRLLVEECGSLVDSKDAAGNTALHYCFSSFYDPLMESRSKDDHAETSRILLEMGAEPNVRNAQGEMPLHLASKNGYERGIEILLTMGANCGDEARNSAGNRPVDLLSDKSGVSATMLKTAARDPQGFLNETLEALSRRGGNMSSANISFNGSNTVTKFSSRSQGICAPSPRMSQNRLAGRTSHLPGVLANSHQPSMESINRMNQFSKQAFQIERSLRDCMNDNDDYLVPQEIPFIDEETVEEMHKERVARSMHPPPKSVRRPTESRKARQLKQEDDVSHDLAEDDESPRRRSTSRERNRSLSRERRRSITKEHNRKTPVPAKKTISDNASSSVWDVTPNPSVASTSISGYNEKRKSRKITNGVCNLSNVFEECSSIADSENNRKLIEKSITRALKRVNKSHKEDISDSDDSFDTVSESEQEQSIKKRNSKVMSPTSPVRKQSQPPKFQAANQKRLRSSGSVSSSFESESSSSNSTAVVRRRNPPPIPEDESPFEMEEAGSCKRLFNVEVDYSQLAEWTIMKFSPVFPSLPSATFLVRTVVAKRIIKLLDNERFLNKLSKYNFNLPDCSTDNLILKDDDFLGHEYENTMPGPNTVRYVLKLCLTENKLEWTKEVTKPPIMSKKNALEKVNGKVNSGKKPNLPDIIDTKKQATSRNGKIISSCSETDSFTSGASSSSNEINSFIPKEARKKLTDLQKTENTNQNGTIKKGFGLQKGGNDNKNSWRTQKTHSQIESEFDRSSKSKNHPLYASPVKGNSASAEDILSGVDGKRRGNPREDLSSTYLNYEDAQDMKRIKSQQNVLNWVSANHETDYIDDEEPTTYERNRSFKSALKTPASLKNQSSTTPSVYEQLDDQDFQRKGENIEYRVVLSESSNSFGFSITGGNAYGIIVKDVQTSSEAQTVGLRNGDELLEVNGKSFEGRSKEESYKMIERCCGRIEFKVRRNHEKRMSYENGDKFFVQAFFDFTPNAKDNPSERLMSPVKQGEIFCVVDSMPDQAEDSWKVYRADSNNNKEELFIPNKSKAIGIMAKTLILTNAIEKKSRGPTILRSFRRNKSIDNDSKYSGINSEFLKPYKNVILVPPQVKRPIFIAGLYSEAICRRLISDSPGLFEIPDKIVEISRFVPDIPTQQCGSMQRSMSNSSLSPIDVEPLKEISARGKHSLCCLSPKAIEFVRQQSDLNPIAIFLSCPNKQTIKDVASALNITTIDVRKNNVVNTMFDNSLRFEKYYSNLFDAILPFRSDLSWFSILKDTIAKMQVIPKWRTVELLDEDEGTLTRPKENNRLFDDNENRHSKTTDDIPEFSKRRGFEDSCSRSKSQRKGTSSKLFPMKAAQSLSEL